MKHFMSLITHTQYQLNSEIHIFTYFFLRLSVFLYVIKKTHVTAQVQVSSSRKKNCLWNMPIFYAPTETSVHAIDIQNSLAHIIL